MARMSFEPNIRYCTAGDGVKIAFCDGGVGTPLVAAAFLNNLEVEARWDWHQILASRRRIVLYDSRGAGSSQRDIAGFSVDEMALDIGAVGQRVAAAARGARTLEQTQAFYGAARLYEVQWRE